MAIIDWVASWCYPGDATVKVLGPDGTPRRTPIADVSVGDVVETRHGYEPVILQGHA